MKIDTTPATAKQIAMIGYLCTRLDLSKDDKAEMVYMHTGGRATSSKDIFQQEAAIIIGVLVDASGLPQKPEAKMQRKILSMAHEMHWELKSGKVDMQRLDNWCMQYGPQKKPFKAFKYEELPTLVTAFTGAYTAFLKGF
jgi:hypothetical protein